MKMRLFLSAACIAAVSLASCAKTSEALYMPKPALQSPEPMDNPQDAVQYISGLTLGYNIGNSLDAHNDDGTVGETLWGNPAISQTLMNGIAKAGFKAVRIPITWLKAIGAAPDYKIDEKYLARVQEVVEYANKAGLKAIINIHHDGVNSQYWLSVKDEVLNDKAKRAAEIDEFQRVWTQIAAYFKNNGGYLMFEGMNELQDGTWKDPDEAQWTIVNDLDQTFVSAVRATGGNNAERFLIVQGYAARQDLARKYLALPKDSAKNRLIVDFHNYDPYDFAGGAKVNKWGKGVTNKADLGGTDWGQEAHMDEVFSGMKAQFIDKGVPVIMDEYGAVPRVDPNNEKYRNYWMEYVTKDAKDHGVVPFYWDNGQQGTGAEKFALLDRTTGEVLPAAKTVYDLMMKAVTEKYDISSIAVPADAAQ